MPAYQNSFYVPQNLVTDEQKPSYLSQYPMDTGIPIPYAANDMIVQANMLSATDTPPQQQHHHHQHHQPQPQPEQQQQQHHHQTVVGCLATTTAATTATTTTTANTYLLEKPNLSTELNYSKTDCMVGSNIPGSSYPIELTAKKIFKRRNSNMKCSKG